MDIDVCPRHALSVFFCPGDDGLLAYDAATGDVHRLNALASLIIELCDGQRSVAEIQKIVDPLLPDASGEAVERCLADAHQAGLLTTTPAAMPETDPAALARQLKADGRIEAAFICQSSAVEREPDQPDHWIALGEISHILGRRAHARAAYERYLDLKPHDAEIGHLLTALRDETPPPRASDDFIQQLYARFSSFYDTNMLEELDYQAPTRLAELVATLMDERAGLDALDLGCGSGLAGVKIRARCAHLTGVDLSVQMLTLARERGIYDQLESAEISAWLERCTNSFDLILACDSLIYFGDLRPVIHPVAALLRPGGCFVFSLECGDYAPFKLHDNGRYSHHPETIGKIAAEAALDIAHLQQGYLRMEYGAPVTGLFVALQSAREPRC